MRARLVTASTWIIVTAALASCRLDPISDPPTPSGNPDSAARGPDAGRPPQPAANPDVRLDEAGIPGGPPDAPRGNTAGTGTDVRSDQSPSVDRASDAAPDVPTVDPLTVGLVAHWRFDEGSGTRTADSTGNGNTATLFNGTAWERTSIPGRPATDFAIRLDGSNDYASCVAGPMVPRIEASKTISFWFAPDSNAPPIADSNQRTCVALLDTGSAAGVQVGLDRNRPAVWSFGQGAGFLITDAVPAAGVRHVTYTFDGNTHRLYLDGALADTSTTLPQQGRANVLYIGTYQPPSELCAGQIDDLRIYNRALPMADITRLAARP